MAEHSYPWEGAVNGDCGPYSSDIADTVMEILYGGDALTEGVVPNWPVAVGLKEYALSNPVAGTLRVAPGACVVKGKIHWSDASVDFSYANPVGSNRVDRIVLRSLWSTTQQIRLTYLANPTEGIATAPTILQSEGSQFDLPLWKITITPAGVVTWAQEWAYRHLRAMVSNSMLDDDCRFLRGMIIDWTGTLGGSDGARPIDPSTGLANEAWHACVGGDAHNGVTIPDLRDRFRLVAGPTHAAGTTGGAETIDDYHRHAESGNTGPASGYEYGLLGSEVQVAPFGHVHSLAGLYTQYAGSATKSVLNPYYAVSAALIYVG
jgi:hypothetical protein